MKKIRYVVLVLIIILVAGCGKKVEEKPLNELGVNKNNMLGNVHDYSYKVSFDTKVDDKDYTITLECDNDLNTRVSHCMITNYYYNIEKYVNYGTKIYYYRNIHPDNTTNWMMMNKYYNTNQNHFLNIVESVETLRKETREDGFYYTGTITPLKMAILLQEVDNRIDTGNIDANITDIPIEVYVNNRGFIEKITSCWHSDEKVEITFVYNEVGQLEMPQGLSN